MVRTPLASPSVWTVSSPISARFRGVVVEMACLLLEVVLGMKKVIFDLFRVERRRMGM